MRRSLVEGLVWMVVAVIPGAAFLWLEWHPEANSSVVVPTGHFYIVSMVSVFSAVLALIAGIGAVRTANARILLLALAFISIAGFFAVHGLATPGFLVATEYRAVIGFSGRMSLLLAGVFLALSAIDLPAAVLATLVRWRIAILAGWLAVLAGYGVASLLAPESIPPQLMNEHIFLRGTLGAVLACSLFAAVRYHIGYRRSGLLMYGAVALGSVLLFEAQVAMHFGPVWRESWWIYHFQLLGAFAAMLGGVAIEYSRGLSPILAIEGLTLRDPVAQIQAGYTKVITAFATALEARDGYTHGHGQRVAALAMLIGEQLRLSPGRLRALGQGALLHDVGKIGVPDDVLNKTGPLDDSEFDVIKVHPVRGAIMLGTAFAGTIELAVIRHHHEKYDGTGYPDGLAGSAIPFEARIATVADVYDALRSTRSYRKAWDRQVALDYMHDQSGTHFDPLCVEAFLAVVDRWEAQYSAEAEEAIATSPRPVAVGRSRLTPAADSAA